MSMPFYVAPEQVMKDRADYARKGIARGRSLVAAAPTTTASSSAPRTRRRTLRKVSEIYDRIAFAGVGRYNEFDQLRIAGVRHADLKGYSFSREDVDARSLANAYAQILGRGLHPRDEADGGRDPRRRGRRRRRGDDQLFHILYDGTVVDEHGYTRPRRRGRGHRRAAQGQLRGGA